LKAFLLTKSDTLKTERDALKAEVDHLEKLTGKAAKPPATPGIKKYPSVGPAPHPFTPLAT